MTIFLLVNGLNGGSTDPDHPGWFELSSANMGVGVGVSNGVIGAPSFSEISVTMEGVAPALLAQLAKATDLGSVRIQQVDSAGDKLYDLLLDYVFVTGNYLSMGDGAPSSSLSFAYKLFNLATPDGSFGYDLANQMASFSDTIPEPEPGSGPRTLESGEVTRYYLLIDGANGGSTNPGGNSKGWFKIESLQFGAGVGVDPNGVTTEPSFSEVVVEMAGVDPLLFSDLATGRIIDAARVQGVNALGQVIYDLRLGDVVLSGNALSTGGGTPSTSLSLNYQQIGLTTPTSEFGYDLANQTAILPNTIPYPVPADTSSLESGGVSRYYLLIDGENGGSTDPDHQGWFEIQSLQFGAGVGVGPGGVTSAPSFSEVGVTMVGVSPGLLGDLAAGRLINAARVQGVNLAGDVVYDLRLGDVVLSSNALGTGGGAPSASLSLNYQQIGLTTPTSEFGYDLANQKAIPPNTIPSPVPANTRSLESGEVTRYYLLIDGANGGLTNPDGNSKGWFKIESLQFGVGVGVGPGGVTTEPSFSEIVVEMAGVDPTLFGDLATGRLIDAARVQGVNALGQVIYDLRLGDVVLSGNALSTGGGAPSSSLSLNYQQIGLTTPTSSFGYDLANKTAIFPNTIPEPAPSTGEGTLESGNVTRYYLLIDGANGGSTNPGENTAGWFEIQSLQFGAGVGVGPNGLTSAPSFSEIVVTMVGVSPALLGDLAAGRLINAARVQGVNLAGDVVYDLLLGDVVLSGNALSTGGDTPSTSMSLNYQQIGLTTPTSSFGYDLANNVVIDPGTIARPIEGGPDTLETGLVTKYYLHVDGINGGSTDAGHIGWFKLSSLQLGAGVGVSNGAASDPSFSDLVVTLTGINPNLYAELATGDGLGVVLVEGVNSAGTVIYDLRLGDAFLTVNSFSTGGDIPQTALSFQYGLLGLVTPTSSFGTNTQTHTAIDPDSILPAMDRPPLVTALTAGVGEDGPAFSQDLLTGASNPNPGTKLAIQDLDFNVTTAGGRVLTLDVDYTLTGSTLSLTAADFAQFNNLSAGQTDEAVFGYVVSDGGLATQNTLTLTINGINDAPGVRSAATGTTAENVSTSTIVYKTIATDPDANTTLVYSISGGADAALFNINRGTGAVTFKDSPNFETPGDVGANNVYDIIVMASDGTLTASKAVAIWVTRDLNIADDTIEVENSISTAPDLGTSSLAAGAFRTGTPAGDADDPIIYNSTTGPMFSDSNSNASDGSVQIALLGVDPALTNADFVVV